MFEILHHKNNYSHAECPSISNEASSYCVCVCFEFFSLANEQLAMGWRMLRIGRNLKDGRYKWPHLTRSFAGLLSAILLALRYCAKSRRILSNCCLPDSPFMKVFEMENEMLSPMAEEINDEMADHYALNPEQFKRFFFLKVFGKPRPNVLPIVSSFTEDVDGVILQLKYFESSLREAHVKYMAEHEKDARLIKMITKLIAGLKEEMRSEERERRSQDSIRQYLLCQRKEFASGKNLELSSLAEEEIKGMTTYALKSTDFKIFLHQVASGKPKYKVLPILRSFTRDEQGVIRQLLKLRNFLREAHKKYMAEHEKDKNVFKRINALIKNIEKEQDQEARKCSGQKSMHNYVLRERN